ncbi:MAG: META domain-containing protein [Bacteroidales bacterium]|nr:META domain-containing protein [Bacteroidales bacterium]
MRKPFLIAVVMLCLIACKSQKNDAKVSNNETPVTIEGNTEETFITFDQLGGTWYVVEINGENMVMNDTLPYLSLDLEQMRVHAYAGCNQINGQIVRRGRAMNSLSFENTMCTRMMCPDDKAEQAINQVLEKVRSFTATASKLELQDENAETIVLLRR